jgi:signal transduction histidine kinase
VPGGAVLAATLFHLISANAAARMGNVFRPMDLLSYALLLVGPVALLLQRRAPIAVLAVASAGSIGFLTFAEPRWTYVVAPVLALFLAVKAGRRRAAIAVTAAAYAAYLASTWAFADQLGVVAAARPDVRQSLLAAVGLALAVVLGGASKVRAEHLAEMAKVRAEQAKARAEQERRQASEERLRIARELHDVLGHHLSLINVQAGVGLHLMQNRPEQAREALAAIKTASAEALREVRAVLGVLRPEEEAAPRQPAPGLDRLAELTADAGLVVTTTTRGVRRPLPAEVDRAAYRIVQEALTNVRRHATAGATAGVTVEYRPHDLAVSIRDDGTHPAPGPAGSPGGGAGGDGVVGGGPGGGGVVGGGPGGGGVVGGGPGGGGVVGGGPGGDGVVGGGPGPGAGSGIAGMRARAESLGGTLDAGPLPGGGFLVSAVLPTTAAVLPTTAAVLPTTAAVVPTTAAVVPTTAAEPPTKEDA